MDEPTPIEVRYRPTAADYRGAALHMARLSRATAAMGGFLIGLSVWPVVNGDLVSFVTLAFGVSLASGLISIPFLWLTVNRRRDLMLGEHLLRVDSNGVELQTPLTRSQQSWDAFKRVRDINGIFLFDYGTNANGMVPKHAFGPDQLAAFLSTAEASGKLERPSELRNWLAGFAIGVAAAAVLIGAIILANQ